MSPHDKKIFSEKTQRLKSLKDIRELKTRYRLVLDGCYKFEDMILCYKCDNKYNFVDLREMDYKFIHESGCDFYVQEQSSDSDHADMPAGGRQISAESSEDEDDYDNDETDNSTGHSSTSNQNENNRLESYGRSNRQLCADSVDVNLTEQTGSLIDEVYSKPKLITPDSIELKQAIRFDSFKTFKQRLITFNEHWPHKNGKMNAKRAALSGFAFANFETALRCFQCAIGLKGFVEDDDPFEEHRIYSPNCEYNNIAIQNGWNKYENIPEEFFK